MSYQPVLSSRYAQPIEIISGSAVSLFSLLIWPICAVELGNGGELFYLKAGTIEGPPTRSYINWTDNSVIDTGDTPGNVVMSLPYSLESEFVQDDLPDGGGNNDSTGMRCSVHWIKRRRYV